MVACELDPRRRARSRRSASTARRPGDRIAVEVGPALGDAATRLADGGEPFDLVFIDADKPGYLGYLELLLDGGLLAPTAR